MSTEHYTHGHHESVLRSHRWRTAENSLGYLLPRLEPGTSLLDVGCGPGNITADLARRLAPGRVVGLDASTDVIDQARADHPDVEFTVGDAYALPYEDGEFDVVQAHQVLHHLDRPVDALREWGRVAGPSGIVAAREVDYAGAVAFPETEGLAAWAALYQRVHRAGAGEPNAGRRLKSWALAAGFREVEAGGSLWVFSSDEDRAWWGGMWADRVLESAFAATASENGLATRDDLESISAAWRAWANDPEGTLFMPHGEIVARR
jgi:ubiquinone/menaquinone biosynthesis C-methylase UbiE